MDVRRPIRRRGTDTPVHHPLDQLDIVLVTGDGSLHVVELKRAFTPKLVVEHRNHLIHVVRTSTEAVSQTENYLRSLDEEAHTIKSKLGAEAHRMFATVVIGDRQHNKLEVSEDFYQNIHACDSHLSHPSDDVRPTDLKRGERATNLHCAEPDEEQDDDGQDDEDDEYDEGEYETDDDPYGPRYDGPGHDGSNRRTAVLTSAAHWYNA